MCEEAFVLKSELLDLYFEDDDLNMRKRTEIIKVHDMYAQDGKHYAVVTFDSQRGEKQELSYDKYSDPIASCLKTEKQRKNLPNLHRFARLLFELDYHPKTGESLLPEVRYSLESYINFVAKNMTDLERDDENCPEDAKEDHDYLKFKEATKYQEQAQWGVICCKLLQICTILGESFGT